MSNKHYYIPEDDSAKSSKQDEIISELQEVNNGVDSLETKADTTNDSLGSVDLNTKLTHKKLDSLIQLQIETNRLLKLILS